MIKFIVKLALLATLPSATFAQNKIEVRLAANLHGPYTGRLMVYTQSDTAKAFGAQAGEQPAFAINVKNWKNGEVQTLSNGAFSYLQQLDSLKTGYYKFVAILDTNTKERGNSAAGNLYTRQEVVAKLDFKSKQIVGLTLSHVFQERKFNQSDSIREVVLKSNLLTSFKKEPVFLKAGVVLPPSYYKDTTAVYPIVYIIPGWGGTHHNANAKGHRQAYGIGLGQEKIYVFLNPETQTPFGLHAFVDSRVNGPWGTALVKELMPYMVNTFRTSILPGQTFITGQSSGGYGAVWLTLHFPKSFGGCWATAPDPLDFSNFTGVDIYNDNNYFTDKNGKEREIFFVNGKATSSLAKMYQKELLEGDGGQQQSFEAEFGMADHNGRPIPLFDPKTGRIYKQVAKSWETYDLARYVQKNWRKIKADVGDKITIYVGQNDNFLLQESALAFAEKIKKVSAPIKVEVVGGADHFSLRSPILAQKIQTEMDAAAIRAAKR